MSDAVDEGLFGEKKAAQLLKVAPRTLRRYRTIGRIGYHRLPGGRVRYSLDQLLEFRSSCRVAASSPPPLSADVAAHGHIWPPNGNRLAAAAGEV